MNNWLAILPQLWIHPLNLTLLLWIGFKLIIWFNTLELSWFSCWLITRNWLFIFGSAVVFMSLRTGCRWQVRLRVWLPFLVLTHFIYDFIVVLCYNVLDEFAPPWFLLALGCLQLLHLFRFRLAGGASCLVFWMSLILRNHFDLITI